MAQCKRCGKKGLLLKLDRNGLCSDCAAAVSREYNRIIAEQEEQIAKMDEELKHQDDLLNIVLKARDDYSEDGDIEKAIATLEDAIINANPPLLMASGHTVFLINLYKKAGQNDKAWGLLNDCLLDASRYGRRVRLDRSKVRLEMAKILKSEKKYSAAVEMYMLKYLDDLANANTIAAEYIEERFLKDIKPCISKLKWDESVQNDLVSIVKATLKNNNSPQTMELSLINNYREYLKEKDL